MRVGDRRGVVLLECIVALAILSVAGAALLSLASAAQRASRHGVERDGRMMRADEYLSRVSLWSAEDLDRHLGARRQGSWVLDVRMPLPRLYEVRLADSAGVALLATTLYRPDSAATNR